MSEPFEVTEHWRTTFDDDAELNAWAVYLVAPVTALQVIMASPMPPTTDAIEGALVGAEPTGVGVEPDERVRD